MEWGNTWGQAKRQRSGDVHKLRSQSIAVKRKFPMLSRMDLENLGEYQWKHKTQLDVSQQTVKLVRGSEKMLKYHKFATIATVVIALTIILALLNIPFTPSHSSNITSSTSLSSGTSSKSAFTNKYGTATTKCAHSGCDNYIASSGDTNCCTAHSNICLECFKYIDEDAMYCMSCLTSAATNSSSGNSKKNSSSASSGKVTGSGAGGYDMPKKGESFSEYVKRVDPDLYGSLFSGLYND